MESARDVQFRHPWHFRLLVLLVTGVAAGILWCWFRTLRVTILGKENEHGPTFVGTWHRGVVFTIFVWRGRNGFFLASASKDGEWATGLIRRMGNFSVRGSSSRGGRPAMQEMVTHLQAGTSGGILSDAPRGPARVSKPGILKVAQRAGVPVTPTQFGFERCLRLKSWDRTMIPYPFSRAVVKYGDPFLVDPALDGEPFNRRLEEFDRVMNALTEEVDAYFTKPVSASGPSRFWS